MKQCDFCCFKVRDPRDTVQYLTLMGSITTTRTMSSGSNLSQTGDEIEGQLNDFNAALKGGISNEEEW